MSEFKRGIYNQDFINALNELYKDKDSFWYKMVNDKEFFIAIREKNKLNVYYNGQSICELSYVKSKKESTIKGKTHKKYLGLEELGYFYSQNGNVLNETSKIKSLAEINKIKINVEKHFGKEKTKSYTEILNGEKFILDVEITLVEDLVPKPTKLSDYKRSSIDYVELEKKGNKLVFYEAKHISNQGLRSRTEPKVLEQIARYEGAIRSHENEILSSYEQVLQNLSDLHILSHRNFTDKKLLHENISIDFEPRLIIFGIEQNQLDNSHIDTLRKHLKSRLILKEI